MAKWEVCHIKNQYANRGKMFHYLAVIDTDAGEKTIDKTIELEVEKGNSQKLDDERAKVVSRLLANGSEPLSSNERGNVNTFRRQVP